MKLAGLDVRTPLLTLRSVVPGVHLYPSGEGEMIIVAARPAMGKALALDTPLPTPSGWTTMGELEADDWVLVHDAARPCLDGGDLEALLADSKSLRVLEHQKRMVASRRAKVKKAGGTDREMVVSEVNQPLLAFGADFPRRPGHVDQRQ